MADTELEELWVTIGEGDLAERAVHEFVRVRLDLRATFELELREALVARLALVEGGGRGDLRRVSTTRAPRRRRSLSSRRTAHAVALPEFRGAEEILGEEFPARPSNVEKRSALLVEDLSLSERWIEKMLAHGVPLVGCVRSRTSSVTKV